MMKIDELRTILKKHKREDVEFFVAELYKLVPKSKKEDYQVDELLVQGKPKTSVQKPKKKVVARSIVEISKEVDLFISNARNDNYICANREVAKKDRPKWRFVVKRLYKEILETAEAGNEVNACCNQLIKLYELLTYACNYIVFNSYDVFESIGISQTDFFTSITVLQRRFMSGKDFVKKSIRLALNNALNRYTLYSELMGIIILQCPTFEMKTALYDSLLSFYSEFEKAPDNSKSNSNGWRNSKYSYEKQNTLNNISESILRLSLELNEPEKGISFVKTHYFANSPEITLYVMVRVLFGYKKSKEIVRLIDESMALKPRESLINLRNYIVENEKLPNYL